MPRGEWLKSLSPEERKRISQSGIEAIQRAKKNKHYLEFVDFCNSQGVDYLGLNLDKEDDVDILLNLAIKYLGSPQASPIVRPNIRLMIEAIAEKKERIDMRKLKQLEKLIPELEKEIRELQESSGELLTE